MCIFFIDHDTFTMFLTLLAGAFSLLLFFCLLHILYSAIASPLRSVPGPFFARFTKLWYLWRVYDGHFEQDNIKLHRKHGEKASQAQGFPTLTY
jgi:Gpi18-like mannosyltransferase